MSAHPPPIPPEQVSNKGPGTAAEAGGEHDPKNPARARDINTAEQGQQGATKQNTTHKGFQQDR